MNWQILCVGRPSFPWVREGVAEYEKRLKRFARVSLCPVKTPGELLGKKKGFLLVLDETGEGLSTQKLAGKVTDLESRGVREITVVMGGADGVGDAVRAEADLLLSLGPQTLMHELALLVWMEQLYRVHTLMAGHPYHRG